MNLTMDTKLVVPEDVLIQDMQDESVLLNLDNSCYYGLDKTGTQMWRALSGSESVQQAYDDLLARFDVEADVLRRDLFGLIKKLMDNGLLKVSDA